MDERPEPTEEELTDYSETGVDRTLIRWRLSLTPAERLKAMEERGNNVVAMCRVILSRNVDFILGGGFAESVHGTDGATLDAAVVYRSDPENVERLLPALCEMGAVFRITPEVRPGLEHFARGLPQLLLTDFGPLDVLPATREGHTFGDLLPGSRMVGLAPGVEVWLRGRN